MLEESRAVLSLIEHGVSRTRQTAGLGRPRLRATAAAAGIDVAWLETTLDEQFSLVSQHRADAGLGWLTATGQALPPPLEVMRLGDFEPDVWLPPGHPAASRRVIGQRQPAYPRPDRTAASRRGQVRAGGTRSGCWSGRHGPRPCRRIPLDRHGGPGVERRSAAPAPAGAFRHRRQHRLLTRPPAAASRHAGGPYRDKKARWLLMWAMPHTFGF
jgi:hypothetical protein